MKRRKQFFKIILAGILFAGGFLAPDEGKMSFLLFGLSYVIVGGKIVLKAFRSLVYGRVLDENFLMTAATFGAFALHQYSEGAAVMLFYQVGELFQSCAVDKSRRSIAALMDIRPEYANLKRGDEVEKVAPEDVGMGDLVIVRPGERIPLDGIVTEGSSLVDTSAVTGEPVARRVQPGEEVVSGCVNLNGVLEVKVSKTYGESTVSRILDLVENASSKKARLENFITRFARYYTPAVVGAAVVVAFLPPLLFPDEALRTWIYRALTFLVVSCPCALVISVPLGFFGGIGAASRNGILVKGGNYLEALSRARTVVFDKTGTLTAGSFRVVEVHSTGMEKERLLEQAAYADSFSNHPVALSIEKAWGRTVDRKRVSEAEEISGRGVRARVDGNEVFLGNAALMEEEGITPVIPEGTGTFVHVAVSRAYAGWIRISDEIKPDAAEAVKELRKEGVRRVVMLTGDNPIAGEAVGAAVGVDEVHAGLLPEQKVEKVEELSEEGEGTLVFVGDGINDAPVLARADVGVAMGGIGSDAAVEAADVVLMTDEPSKVADAVRIGRRTLKIVRENIAFALGVKAVVLLLSLVGLASMWEAVFADVGVSVLAILNSVRALSFRRRST